MARGWHWAKPKPLKIKIQALPFRSRLAADSAAGLLEYFNGGRIKSA
jgi:hypothetical protein